MDPDIRAAIFRLETYSSWSAEAIFIVKLQRKKGHSTIFVVILLHLVENPVLQLIQIRKCLLTVFLLKIILINHLSAKGTDGVMKLFRAFAFVIIFSVN